jgi:predicted porin
MLNFSASNPFMLTNSMLKKLVLAGLLAFSAQVCALDVLQQASVTAGIDFDTNPLLSSVDKQSIWRYYATPRYSISTEQDQNRWYLDGSLRVQRSSDRSIAVDREDPSINAGWTRQYDRGNYGLVARYSRTSTRITEFDGTGLVAADGSSTAKSLAANWAHLLTERLNLNLGSQYSKTEFSGGGGFSDFTTKSINAGLSYQLTETISPYIQVNFSKFTSGGAVGVGSGGGDTNSQNYLAGANFTFTPRWSLGLGAGINHVSSVGSSWIADANSTYLGERYQVTGTLGRSVSASGIGNFQESDRAALGYSYELTELSRLGVDYSWRKNRSLNDSETQQLSGYYGRDLSDSWQMRLTAQMRELKTGNVSANGNIFGISFVYNTPEF